jgi:hypothetical protein
MGKLRNECFRQDSTSTVVRSGLWRPALARMVIILDHECPSNQQYYRPSSAPCCCLQGLHISDNNRSFGPQAGDSLAVVSQGRVFSRGKVYGHSRVLARASQGDGSQASVTPAPPRVDQLLKVPEFRSGFFKLLGRSLGP